MNRDIKSTLLNQNQTDEAKDIAATLYKGTPINQETITTLNQCFNKIDKVIDYLTTLTTRQDGD